MAVEKPNLVIYGRVIALSPVTEIPSREANKPAMKKRELYVDCTRYDSITGIRDERENKPLFEIGGDKLLEKVASLNLQKGDVIAIKFAIQGTPYKDQQTQKTKVFTAIRVWDVEVIRLANGSEVQQAHIAEPQRPAPAPQPEPAPSPAPQNASGKAEDLPF